MMREPLAIDLFCGLGGWSEALIEEGYDVIGFDIERHQYGEHRYPGQLVIQDVRALRRQGPHVGPPRHPQDHREDRG